MKEPKKIPFSAFFNETKLSQKHWEKKKKLMPVLTEQEKNTDLYSPHNDFTLNVS